MTNKILRLNLRKREKKNPTLSQKKEYKRKKGGLRPERAGKLLATVSSGLKGNFSKRLRGGT